MQPRRINPHWTAIPIESRIRNDFTLKPIDWWKSPKTGARYPIAWTLDIPSMKLHLTCRAALQDQELAASHGAKYWEGAVDYSGSQHGVGYLEMTGYDGPLKPF